ncbi:hypothetical protein QTO34_006108 [Cnephaeus nilssonii]|uniref:Uncharacterized protein n=1 Tax=Cnephaeus nilssonii TaxID=3371016 RepID=A0AA40LHF1_CNENI|nr:hypothetical protein QTO34_006108 [Eptesicus nilssonii]
MGTYRILRQMETRMPGLRVKPGIHDHASPIGVHRVQDRYPSPDLQLGPGGSSPTHSSSSSSITAASPSGVEPQREPPVKAASELGSLRARATVNSKVRSSRKAGRVVLETTQRSGERCQTHPLRVQNRRGLWGSELTSRRGPSKAWELGACLLQHQAFQKPPLRWRLPKGLVHQRTGTQLPRDRKRKRVGDPT